MKYLKSFEDYEDLDDYDDDPLNGTLADDIIEEKERGKYWLIPTDERFKKSLIAIGCKDEDFMNKDFRDYGEFIYACDDEDGWGFMPHGKNNYDSIRFMKDEDYEDMGTQGISDIELNQIKYNI
jgi:hypothetical protein